MKTTNDNKRLTLGKTYFCNWAWRSAKYIGTRKDDRGIEMAYFKDVCDCIVKIEAEVVKDHIDWEKTKEYDTIPHNGKNKYYIKDDEKDYFLGEFASIQSAIRFIHKSYAGRKISLWEYAEGKDIRVIYQ